jgi:hypothetical protein
MIPPPAGGPHFILAIRTEFQKWATSPEERDSTFRGTGARVDTALRILSPAPEAERAILINAYVGHPHFRLMIFDF